MKKGGRRRKLSKVLVPPYIEKKKDLKKGWAGAKMGLSEGKKRSCREGAVRSKKPWGQVKR